MKFREFSEAQQFVVRISEKLYGFGTNTKKTEKALEKDLRNVWKKDFHLTVSKTYPNMMEVVVPSRLDAHGIVYTLKEMYPGKSSLVGYK